MTIKQAHQAARTRLNGSQAPDGETAATSRLLLDDISGLSHAHLRQPERVLSPLEAARFESALCELENQRPLAYVLGYRFFCGHRFGCDERALIPRPETETLVEAATEAARSRDKNETKIHLADLGTGTGCIAVSLALAFPGAQVYATDISANALALARENASTHGVADRIQLVPGVADDWAAPLQTLNLNFDILVSNPPYIARDEITNLQREIRNYEPRAALDGGADGLDAYRQLAAQCRTLLAADGVLLCELGAEQWRDARAIFETHHWRVEDPICDLAGIARVLRATPA